MIQKTPLPSGATLLTEFVDYTDAVSIGFWFLTGSRDETDEERGLTHFLEHMLFKGTGRRSAFQIAQEIDRVGGMLNAFTEKEHTCFYCTLPSEHLNLAVDVILDMLFNSTFAPEEIEKEKRVILNEIQSSEDSPEDMVYDLFLYNLWKTHSLAGKITGTENDVQAINREKLDTFHRRWIVPSNMLISVAGRFDIGELPKLLNNRLPDIQPLESRGRRVVPLEHQKWDYQSGPFSQVNVLTGFTFPIPEQIEELYSFLIFSTLFGESMSSRLFQNIRENEGLCYTIYSMRSFFESIAMWTVYSGTTEELLDNLIKSLDRELNSVLNEDISENEIHNAITHLVGGVILSKDDMEVRMKRLVRHFVIGGELHDVPTTIAKLESVTKKDVDTFITKYLSPRSFSFLAYGTRKLHRKKKKYFAIGKQG